MPYRIPDTVYDSGINAFWQNASDRVAYQRSFDQESGEKKRIAQAMIVANPLTSNLEIQGNMNNPNVPERFGYNDEPLTIEQVLGNELDPDNVNTNAWNDFSGKNSSYSGTDIPSLPIW